MRFGSYFLNILVNQGFISLFLQVFPSLKRRGQGWFSALIICILVSFLFGCQNTTENKVKTNSYDTVVSVDTPIQKEQPPVEEDSLTQQEIPKPKINLDGYDTCIFLVQDYRYGPDNGTLYFKRNKDFILMHHRADIYLHVPGRDYNKPGVWLTDTIWVTERDTNYIVGEMVTPSLKRKLLKGDTTDYCGSWSKIIFALKDERITKCFLFHQYAHHKKCLKECPKTIDEICPAWRGSWLRGQTLQIYPTHSEELKAQVYQQGFEYYMLGRTTFNSKENNYNKKTVEYLKLVFNPKEQRIIKEKYNRLYQKIAKIVPYQKDAFMRYNNYYLSPYPPKVYPLAQSYRLIVKDYIIRKDSITTVVPLFFYKGNYASKTDKIILTDSLKFVKGMLTE